MKWLLYALVSVVVLIGLAIAVLLALGGFRGESRLTASVEINRPPEVVFSWVTEPERLESWVGWLLEVRTVTPHVGVGNRQIWVMEDRNNNNQRMEIESEVVTYRPPYNLNARVKAVEGFTGNVDYAIESLGPDRARLNYVASYQFDHWLAKLLEPVISRSAQQKLEEDLARLKEKAEAAPAGVAKGME